MSYQTEQKMSHISHNDILYQGPLKYQTSFPLFNVNEL